MFISTFPKQQENRYRRQRVQDQESRSLPEVSCVRRETQYQPTNHQYVEVQGMSQWFMYETKCIYSVVSIAKHHGAMCCKLVYSQNPMCSPSQHFHEWLGSNV